MTTANDENAVACARAGTDVASVAPGSALGWNDPFPGADPISVLICAAEDRRGASAPYLARLAGALGQRVLGCVGLEPAQARIADTVDVDAVVLSCSGLEPEVEPLLRALDCAARTRGLRLIVIVDLAGLDRVHALLESPGAIIMCDPRPEDVLAALGGLTHRVDSSRLNDNRGGDGESPFDRLNDQIMRLSRMVETLVQHRQPDALALWSEGSVPVASHLPTPVHAASGDGADSPVSGPQVRALLRARRLREHVLAGDLFADPAWDMLLDLIAPRLERTQVSVSSLCIAASVPPTTALRWIRHLTERGLLQREADPEDGRRVFVALSGRGADAMMRWLRESRALFVAAAGFGEPPRATSMLPT